VFSPVKITVGSSAWLRALQWAVGAIAVLSVLLAEIHVVICIGCLLLIAYLSVGELRLPVTGMVWDLNKKHLKIKCSEELQWSDVSKISSIVYTPLFVYLKVITTAAQKRHVLVIRDSVEKSQYRKLMVAARLGKLTIACEPIQNLLVSK